jgi:aspartate-semialdehyde dehydrogenase
MPDAYPRIAIIGATGAVGREALAILAQRHVSPERIVALGSTRSAGTSIPYLGTQLSVHELRDDAIPECDLALFCADADTALRFAPRFAEHGSLVVDNSSAFRTDPSVPLVVPEINGHLLDADPPPRIVANPNCSTIMLLVALEPIRRALGVRAVTVSTYQAVSGAGAAGVDELLAHTRAAASGQTAPTSVFPEPCALNVFPHESPLDPVTGFNGEERKMIAESRRIWSDPTLSVLPTCVRVPVLRAHAQSVVVDLETPASRAELEAVLSGAPGVRLVDNPTPLKATGRDDVLVGRVRLDPDSEGRRAMLWLCADQLRKGAALNTIQIADRVAMALTN